MHWARRASSHRVEGHFTTTITSHHHATQKKKNITHVTPITHSHSLPSPHRALLFSCATAPSLPRSLPPSLAPSLAPFLPLRMGSLGRWKRIDGSRAWQDGVFDGLCVAYGLVALSALVQIVRIQVRASQYGWTTQKAFQTLNLVVCGSRSAVFGLRRRVMALSGEFAKDLLLGLPALGFLSTYGLLVLFWAEIYYQTRSTLVGNLHPLFLGLNASVYAIQIAVWAWSDASGQRDAGLQISGCFVACVSAAVASCFVLYGSRLFLMLRRFPIESGSRRSKLREVGVVAVACASSLFLRAAALVWWAFEGPDAGLDVLSHPLLNLGYYALTEVIPAAVVLYVLRKLPPRRTPQGYAPIPAQYPYT